MDLRVGVLDTVAIVQPLDAVVVVPPFVDRAAEFATKGLSRDELRREIAATISEIESSIGGIHEAQLDGAYPLAIAERQVRTGDFLAHLAVHLTYHLGQIDYHRRINQWFDHYLKGNPPAKWIVEGQTALDRKAILDANK